MYIGIYFYDELKQAQALRDRDKQFRATGFEVLVGKILKKIPFQDIAHFHVDQGTTYLYTLLGRRYVMDDSLNKIMSRLPEEQFFRLNRKYIVNRVLISGYKKDVNGKLQVTIDLKEATQEQTVSRTTAPDFKRWFSTTVQES